MYRPAALHAILLLILSLSAVLLSFRLLHGPVESLHFDSPLNIEGIFSIVLLFLLVLHSAKHKGEATCDTPFFGRYTLAAGLLLVLITLGLFWRSLSWNFLSDDYVHLSRPFNGDTIAAAFRPGGDGSFRPFGFLVLSVQSLWFVLLWRVWAVSFFPVNWSAEPALLTSITMMLGILTMIALSRVPMSRVLVAGMLAFTLVSILPALHLLLIGRDLAKARLLYFPVVGVSLLLGAGIAAMRTKRQAVITAALLILFQIGMLNHNLRIWHEVSAIADRNGTDVAAAASANSSHSVVVWNVPPVLRGVQFFGNGLPEYVRHTSGLPDTSVVLRYGQVTADRRAGVLAWDPACERFEKLK
jgi:hypothetical protein